VGGAPGQDAVATEHGADHAGDFTVAAANLAEFAIGWKPANPGGAWLAGHCFTNRLRAEFDPGSVRH
jgi:hypothetical protein